MHTYASNEHPSAAKTHLYSFEVNFQRTTFYNYVILHIHIIFRIRSPFMICILFQMSHTFCVLFAIPTFFYIGILLNIHIFFIHSYNFSYPYTLLNSFLFCYLHAFLHFFTDFLFYAYFLSFVYFSIFGSITFHNHILFKGCDKPVQPGRQFVLQEIVNELQWVYRNSKLVSKLYNSLKHTGSSCENCSCNSKKSFDLNTTFYNFLLFCCKKNI